MVPHGTSEIPTDKHISVTRSCFSSLSISGCRFHTKPPVVQRHKLENNVRNFILLEYTETESQMSY